MPIFCDMQVTA